MTTRAALKNNAKQRIRENLTPVLTVSALLAAVNFLLDLGGDALEILRLFLDGVLMIPFCYFMLRLLRTGTARTEDFFSSFSNAIRWMLAGLWQGLWVFLWSLLLVIPGIVKTISYSQYFFILADNPEADLRQALKTSIRMTGGHKADLFLLALSFFNWVLVLIVLLIPLSVLINLGVQLASVFGSLVVALVGIWLQPFFYGTFAGVYEDLKREALETGVCAPEEFGLDAAPETIDLSAPETVSDADPDIAAVDDQLSAIESEMADLKGTAPSGEPDGQTEE